MRLFILLCLLFIFYSLPAQNYLDSLKNLSSVCFLNQHDFDALGINEIKIYTFLSPEEIKRVPVSKKINSKVLIFKYQPPGRIKEQVKNYSGLDSAGVNQIANNEDVLINGMVYYYDSKGNITSTLSYGANVTPNSGYIYDHENQLVMIRYYFDKVMHKYSESAGRTIFDYYPQNGKIKYRIKLDNKGAIEKAEYFIYDKGWNLLGISSTPDSQKMMPYKPYTDLGKIDTWRITINNVPVDNFLYNKNRKQCKSVLMETAPGDYYYFEL